MACNTTVHFVTSALVSLPVTFRFFVKKIYVLCDRINMPAISWYVIAHLFDI